MVGRVSRRYRSLERHRRSHHGKGCCCWKAAGSWVAESRRGTKAGCWWSQGSTVCDLSVAEYRRKGSGQCPSIALPLAGGWGLGLTDQFVLVDDAQCAVRQNG